jgi:hypothetical protein
MNTTIKLSLKAATMDINNLAMNTTNATTCLSSDIKNIPWHKRPETKERYKKYLKEYVRRPDVKKHRKKYIKKYNESTAAKKYRKEYNKEYNREYNQRAERIERRKAYQKEYIQRPEVKERFNKYVKEYIKRPETRELRKKQRKKLSDKGYYKRPEVREYRLARYKNDVKHKLLSNLRSRIRKAVKNFGNSKKAHKTIELTGCTIIELKAHLESLWVEGMSWVNYAKDGWHIDHIRPCNTFDLTDPTQQKECFHYTNLRPLWAKDNWSRPKDGSDIN